MQHLPAGLPSTQAKIRVKDNTKVTLGKGLNAFKAFLLGLNREEAKYEKECLPYLLMELLEGHPDSIPEFLKIVRGSGQADVIDSPAGTASTDFMQSVVTAMENADFCKAHHKDFPLHKFLGNHRLGRSLLNNLDLPEVMELTLQAGKHNILEAQRFAQYACKAFLGGTDLEKLEKYLVFLNKNFHLVIDNKVGPGSLLPQTKDKPVLGLAPGNISPKLTVDELTWRVKTGNYWGLYKRDKMGEIPTTHHLLQHALTLIPSHITSALQSTLGALSIETPEEKKFWQDFLTDLQHRAYMVDDSSDMAFESIQAVLKAKIEAEMLLGGVSGRNTPAGKPMTPGKRL